MTAAMHEIPIDEHVEHIDAEGYTIIEDAVEPALVDTLRDTIRRLERDLDVRPLGTAAEGHSTLRMYNLLAKHPASGTPNPFKGNVIKISRVNGIINWRYGSSVNRQRVRSRGDTGR